ncbi:MAG: hypothetical protein ACFCUX_09705 [Candidatus Methylacidiphilales bacterium]
MEHSRVVRPSLKPYDPVIACYLASLESWSNYRKVAGELSMSHSMLHSSVARLRETRLISADLKKVNKKQLLDFIRHGVPCVFHSSPGEMTIGIPTSHGCPILKKLYSDENTAYVWPHKCGEKQGYAVEPLHRKFPDACLENELLYNICGCIDGIRIGRARDKQLALEALTNLLDYENTSR